MNLESKILSKVTQTQRDKNLNALSHTWILVCNVSVGSVFMWVYKFRLES